jgi:tetratricopeptide (TPR) repeat protein
VELYADEKGTEVDDIALLGVVYTNLAVAARQKGDLEAAAALDSRAELFVDPSAIPMLHLVRASMLGELAIEKLDLGKTAEAVGLAMLAAQIAPAGEDARLALHNLRAMAQRRLEELSKGSEDRALLDFADRFRAFPDIARDLRSRAWTLIGIARNERGDLDGAAAAAREAARLGAQSGSPVLAHNVGVAEINRVLELAKTDPERAWTAWQTLAVPPDLAATRKQLGATIASARAQRALETHRCADLDRRVEELAALSPDAPGDALRASCRNDEGLAHWKTGDFVKAAASFREALRIKPDEGAYRRNLGGALAQRANKLLQTHRCAEAMKVVEEGRSVAPEDPFFDKAAEYCDAEKR